MLRIFLISFFLLPINLIADALLSSPKLSLNAQGERVIEFKIQSPRISDQDIILKEYKSEELLTQENISYTLLEDYSNYKSFSIVLKDEYEGNYFNFKLVIKNELAKDIFIFLPSKINISPKKKPQQKIYKPIPDDIEIPIEILEPKKTIDQSVQEQQRIIKASDISTMWSMASNIKQDTTNTSIYQIMWSIYLGNKDAFIDGNINLVRNDKDLIIPSFSSMSSISDSEARSSILAMNESYSLSLVPAMKSLLVLTAPKIKEAPTPKIKEVIEEDTSKPVDINNENLNDPKSLIENNTTTLEMAIESKVAEELIKETEILETETSQGFGLMDLLFVAFVSILSGVLIALIYIQLKSRQPKKIDYDFEEASDSPSSIEGLPKGLSIQNNQDEQQLDLAITYNEMGDFKNAKTILENLIKSTDNEALKINAQNLLDTISEQ